MITLPLSLEEQSPFQCWEHHYWWLVHMDNFHHMVEDHRGEHHCCQSLVPVCAWCVMDYWIDYYLSLFQKHWRSYRRHRFQNIWRRQLTGRWAKSPN